MRGKRIASIVAVLLLAPAMAFAQAHPDPEPTTGRGSAVLSYNLAAIEGMDPWGGIQLEADWQPANGSWFSVVAHVHSGTAVGFAAVGPRATWDLGPVSIFGHLLAGQAHYGGQPTDGLDAKGGGGLEIPILGRWIIRLGADHDGNVAYTSIGIGARF